VAGRGRQSHVEMLPGAVPAPAVRVEQQRAYS